MPVLKYEEFKQRILLVPICLDLTLIIFEIYERSRYIPSLPYTDHLYHGQIRRLEKKVFLSTEVNENHKQLR